MHDPHRPFRSSPDREKARGMGLTRVPTSQLKAMLAHVHRKELACPVTPAQLAPLGFQAESESIMSTLRGMDEAATRSLLVAVIAERMVFEADVESGAS